MKQHPIPQNIMDVEFKLVGDLTLRQFIYLGVGGALAYASFISDLSMMIKLVSVIFFGGSSLAFAFIPINDRSLDVWLLNFVKAISRPQRRIWQKTNTPPEFLLTKTTQSVAEKPTTTAPVKDHKERLTKYLEGVEKVAEPSEIEEEEKKFLSHLKFDRPLPIKREVDIEEKLRGETPPLPALKNRQIEEKKETLATQINYSTQPVYTVYTADKVPSFSTTLQNTRVGRTFKEDPIAKMAQEVKPLPEGVPAANQPLDKRGRAKKPAVAKREEHIEPETKEALSKRNEQMLSEIKGLMNQLKSYRVEGPGLKKTPEKMKEERTEIAKRERPGFSLRKLFKELVSLKRDLEPKKKISQERPVPSKETAKPPKITIKEPKKSFFEYITPKEEKVISPKQPPPPIKKAVIETEKPKVKPKAKKTKAEVDFEKTIDFYHKEIERLRKEKESLAAAVKTQKPPTKPAPTKREKPQTLTQEYQKQLRALREQNQELKAMIQATQRSLEQFKQREELLKGRSTAYNRQLQEQETLLDALRKEKVALGERLKLREEHPLQQRPRETKRVERKEEGELNKAERKEVKQEKVTKTPIISDKPNVVNGIVKGKDGNLIEGAIVIIKDEKGDPVRALKTNNLGQFAISTPLPNGTYQLTVERIGTKFDIIEVEVTGTVLKPIILEGK